jgi:restriction system protein
MARPNKTRFTTQSWIDSFIKVPWWAYALLAVASYALLRMLVGSQAGSLAGIAQYALPAILLIVAFVCWTRGKQTAPGQGGQAIHKRLDRLSAEEFDSLLAEAFRLQGYLIVDNVGGGTANRVDLVLRRDRASYLVLSKYWKDSRIDAEIVQQLHSSMLARAAAGGFVVTLGRFSRDATAFAGSSNIRLIDGVALRAMVERAHAARSRGFAAAS